MKRPLKEARVIGPLFNQEGGERFTDTITNDMKDIASILSDIAIDKDPSLSSRMSDTLDAGALWSIYPRVSRSDAGGAFGVSGQSASNTSKLIADALNVQELESTGGMIPFKERDRLAIEIRDVMIKELV